MCRSQERWPENDDARGTGHGRISCDRTLDDSGGMCDVRGPRAFILRAIYPPLVHLSSASESEQRAYRRRHRAKLDPEHAYVDLSLRRSWVTKDVVAPAEGSVTSRLLFRPPAVLPFPTCQGNSSLHRIRTFGDSSSLTLHRRRSAEAMKCPQGMERANPTGDDCVISNR